MIAATGTRNLDRIIETIDSAVKADDRICGSSHFGSRTSTKAKENKCSNFGSSRTSLACQEKPSKGDDEEAAGSTCDSRLHGSGSSLHGCPLNELRIFQTIMPEGVNAITGKNEWEEIEMAVDSGATETVIGEDMLSSIEMKDSWASKHGVEYEVANGERIPNMGEKKFQGITESGTMRNLTAQVSEVNKALLSVKKIIAAGNRVVFDEDGSYIEDKNSQEKIWLKEDKGMFMLKMWVKNSVF
jgi:hypothetical protein